MIHQELFDFCKEKTLIVITHRLENINKFDRVIVMEKGKIVEQGKPEELRLNSYGFLNNNRLNSEN